MRQRDEFSGSKPYTGKINFLEYILSKKNKSFIEPFNKAPPFLPTSSIDSSLNCTDFPVCYISRFMPAWPHRIIYYPESMVNCIEYSSIPALAMNSSHIPIYANCKIKVS